MRYVLGSWCKTSREWSALAASGHCGGGTSEETSAETSACRALLRTQVLNNVVVMGYQLVEYTGPNRQLETSFVSAASAVQQNPADGGGQLLNWEFPSL